jgi:hypothetical protein
MIPLRATKGCIGVRPNHRVGPQFRERSGDHLPYSLASHPFPLSNGLERHLVPGLEPEVGTEEALLSFSELPRHCCREVVLEGGCQGCSFGVEPSIGNQITELAAVGIAA